MVRFKTKLDGRDPSDIRIKPEEAWQMFELGFHFAIYGDAKPGEYQLRIPYETIHVTGSDEIVFQQP